VKITVERRDKIKVAVSQIFDRVKSVALWSANIHMAKDHKGYGSAATQWPNEKGQTTIFKAYT
jgi:hypothetical protein